MKNYKLAKLLIIFFILLCIVTSLYYGDSLLLGSFSEFDNDDVKYIIYYNLAVTYLNIEHTNLALFYADAAEEINNNELCIY